MILVKKIKIKINQECKNYLEFASERCRLIYNFALKEKIDFYEKNKKQLSIYEQKSQLPSIKKEYPEYNKVYNKCLSAMYFRLDKAFKRFFNNGKGFPKYKRKKEFISQEYPGMYIKKIDDYRFILPTGRGYNNFTVRTSEPIPDDYRTVTIIKQKNNYFVCFAIEVDEKLIINNDDIIGIDLGVKTLAVGYSSRNELIRIDKFSHYTKHIDKLRSKRDKCIKFSRRWFKQNRIFHRQITRYLNRINDYYHKASYWLTNIRPESTIVVGRLNLNGMIKEKQPWFNRIIQNEWRIGRFVEFLNYKSKLYGKNLIKINEAYTSKTCSRCGKTHNMPLNKRTMSCDCGLKLDRDINSAINIFKKYCTASALDEKLSSMPISVGNLLTDIYVYN